MNKTFTHSLQRIVTIIPQTMWDNQFIHVKHSALSYFWYCLRLTLLSLLFWGFGSPLMAQNWKVSTTGILMIDVWMLNSTTGWAVGNNNLIQYTNDGGSTWNIQPSGTIGAGPLFAVWGSDANNVWAVGSGGTILKYDGTAWTTQNSGTTRTLMGIWGSDANNVWAVGDLGTILKYDGTAWTTQNSGTTRTLIGIWGSDANNVWAVGDLGTILKYDGTAWTTQTSGTTNVLNNVWGSSGTNDVWSVGESGTILKYDGTAWTTQTSSTTNSLYGVWGRDASNVWAVGDGGTILKYNGTTWAAQTSGTTNLLYAVWGSNANNIWAVGNGGTILKYNGTAWVVQTSGTGNAFQSIWGSDVNNIWAVGAGGTIFKYNGTAWTTQTSGTTSTLRGIWGSNANNIWAVGDGGTILKYDGTAWTAQISGTTRTLIGIWGSDANNVWAVGASGTILKYDGTAWTTQNSGATNSFVGIWGSDANNIWAVGAGGNILKYDGTAWTTQTSGTTSTLRGIWGSNANNIWAVGDGGTILKYNGTAWTAQNSGTTNSFAGIWGSDANNVWAVGARGTILKYNGTAWSTETGDVPSLTNNGIFGIADKGFIAATSGTILTRILSVVVTPPTITTTGTLTAFSACANTASAQQSFTVSGSDLSANIVVTAPAGFEVSTSSSSGFGPSVTLARSGTSVASTAVFVRMAAAASSPTSSNVTCASTGATTRNVAVSGTVNALPTVSATGSSVCQGSVLSLSSSVSAGTYTWTGPNGFSSTVQNPTVSSSATSAMAGVYTIRVTNVNNCTATATANVTVISASSANASGATVCAGTNLSISASGGTNYSWTGPNGFTSTLQNPTISSSATTSMTGIYTVLISACSVTTTSTVSVTVNPNPTASATGATVCTGTNLSISASGGTSYLWTGPNGFSSSVQNPTVSSSATSVMAGVYTVRVTNANNCTATTTTSVTINLNPTASATGTTVCAGTSLNISSSGGTSYLWTGPNGFSSTVQNPTVSSNATSAMGGVYTIRVTNASNCTATTTASVTVNPSPTASATGVTVCASTSLSISASGGTSYLWSGPNGFSSTIQNPTVSSSATSAMAGVYTVRVTNANSCTTTATANVTVNSAATRSATGANVCVGTPLSVSASGGTGYNWTGPNAFTSTVQNPIISSSATQSMAGIYTVAMTGCSATTTSTVSVTVNSNLVPNASGATVCVGNSLSVSASEGIAYSWSGPNSFTSTLQSPIISNNASQSMAGIYFIVITGCSSTTTSTVSVVVNTNPTASATGATVCSGTSLSVSASGGTSYLWTAPNGFITSGQNPTINANALSSMAGIYTVVVTNANNCSATATANVVVNPTPTASATGTVVCVGGALSISSSGGTSYAWAGPNGFTSSVQNPTVAASATAAMSGVYTVVVSTSSNCTATATTNVSVNSNTNPTASISYAGSPFCRTLAPVAVTLTGTANGVFSAAPAGLIINPSTGTISPNTSTAGTYTVSYTISGAGCTPFVATTSVQVTNCVSNFITRWDLSKPGSSVSNGTTSLIFGVVTSGTVNYTWSQVGGTATGSGTLSGNQVAITIPNLPAGITIDLSIAPANLQHIFVSSSNKERLMEIRQWGSVAWTSMEGAFRDAKNMTLTATDVPNFGGVTSMAQMFFGCSSFNQSVSNFNTTNVTNMSDMFFGCSSFNQSVSNFNTTNVTGMSGMFNGCSLFNQSVSNFNTTNVTNMSYMFGNCSVFNQSVSNFNTTNVTNMSYMFGNCSVFNQSVSNFNTANVTNMYYMFGNCSVFNQSVSNFNTANVTNMIYMFAGCSVFNQSVSNFNTEKVTNMTGMFYECSSFNQSVSNFNTSSVTGMSSMFNNCRVFNQSVSNFNTANVTNMESMFYGADQFNQSVSNFNTANVTNMRRMFYGADQFNQSLSNFNTANVTNMEGMFYGAGQFNQSLSNFNTANVTNMYAMFKYASSFNQSLAAWGNQLNSDVNLDNFLDYSGMNAVNYDATLAAFSASGPPTRSMGAIGLRYCTATAARANLITAKGWTIFGDTDSCNPVISSTSLSTACEGSTITITGKDFTGATAVRIGGIAVGSFSVINDRLISATVVGGNIGTLSVTTPTGTGTSGFIFTTKYIPTLPIIYGPVEICGGVTTPIIAFSSIPNNSTANITYGWTGNLSGRNVNVAPLSTRSYRVAASFNGCTSDSSAAYTPTVLPKPANPSIVPSSLTICKGQTVSLTGSCSTANASFRWTTPPLNINPALPSTDVRSITEPGVYKGFCESDRGCLSDEVSITITQGTNCSGQTFITITPEKPFICPGASIVMTASGCTGGTLTWTGGATGTSVTLSPAATTVYTVNCSTGGSGTFTLGVATSTLAVASDVLTGKERFRATTTLTSDKKVGSSTITPGANVIYEAGRSITLLPGFAAEKWSVFKAEIKTCTN